MKENNTDITEPTIGCKIGLAYRILLSQLEKSLYDAGLALSANEYLILRAIYNNDGAQQCEISELIGKDKAVVSRCVETMIRKNLVCTQEVSHKCRKVFCTDEALRIKPIIMSVAADRHNALLQLAEAENLIIFKEILNKIINSKSN